MLITPLRHTFTKKKKMTRNTRTYPHRRLSSVWFLQPEDLSHHVFCGRMQQDSAWGQSNHNVPAHRGQTYRDGIGTCTEMMWSNINTQVHLILCRTVILVMSSIFMCIIDVYGWHLKKDEKTPRKCQKAMWSGTPASIIFPCLDLGLSLLERSVKENGQHSKGPIHTGTLCQQIRLLSGGSLCQSPVSRWLTGLMQSRHSFGWKDSCKHLPNVVRLLLNWPIYYPCVPSLRRSMETA